jgi:CRISPR-associated protein, Csh2 family
MATTSTYPYRSEIVFLYDIFRCNPNGDPFENRPRQDSVTGKIEVTDVRLKRTIRDYILNYKHDEKNEDGLDVFVRVVGEKALTAERRYEEIFKSLPVPDKIEEAKNALVKQCVDVRMFGGLVPITKKAKAEGKEKKKGEEASGGMEEGAGVQLTGAVQFNPGQSLHAAEIIEVSGTGGFASSEKAKQKTFRREFYVPYALIGFYGVINEAVAKETGLTEQDVNLLMEAMWNGTLFLHSRSKAFHHPRLLLRFDYKDQRQSGYLLESVKLSPVNRKEEKEIRSPKDYNLDIAPLFERVRKQDGFIERVFCRYDDGLPHFSNLETALKTHFGPLNEKLIVKKGQEQ